MNRIINTIKDKCVACNKCIMICPIKYANNVELIDGERKIEIDKDRCISCGKCLKVCDHEARYYTDDTEDFFEDLKAGNNISLIVAPSIQIAKKDEYEYLLGYLRSLGIDLIYDVSFGADITSWCYINHIKENPNKTFISQPCPTIVNYIEKYVPELTDHLMPFNSPAVNTAIYIKKYLNKQSKIAFLSPCIAKKTEFSTDNSEAISYNVTYESLKNYILKNSIDIFKYPKSSFDNIPCGMGGIYSRPGGLTDNLHFHLPHLKIKQLEGPNVVYDFINALATNENINKYDFIDLLNCEDGCNIGTGISTNEHKDEFDRELVKETYLDIQKSKENISKEDYLKLFQEFNNTLDIRDFNTTHINRTKNIQYSHPNEEELNESFNRLHKNDSESRKINCYSCGYKTCKDMAIAIHNNYNIPSSCYAYNKSELEEKQNSLKIKNDELNSTIHILNVATKEKEENEQYIRTILEHLTESVIVTDHTGKIEFANNETEILFGLPLNEYKDKHIQNFINDLDMNIVINEKRYLDEFVVKNIKGQKIFIKLETNKLEFNDNIHFVYIIEDITKVKEIDNLKNQFISMISHELRTPLTSIRGALGIVSSGALGNLPTKVTELVNIANNNCVRLVNLINDILDLEKIKAGKMSFDFAEYNSGILVEESVKLNEEYAKQYNIIYDITENTDAIVNIDKDRFIQVMTNLLSNAAKFSKPGSKVEVSASREKGSIVIAVKDYGSGIPQEQFSKLFKTFSQLDGSDSRKKGGSGLGLSICKSLINKMGGNIGVSSKVGQGSTFYFDLPEIKQSGENRNYALVCEDNKLTAQYIKEVLNNLCIEVDIAYTAAEAEQFLSNKGYDFMTLDLMLPDKHGSQLLKEIRANNATKELPVIVISALSQKNNDLEIEDLISDWIEKSFEKDKLKKIIDKIIEKNNANKIKILHVEDDKDILNVISSSLIDVAITTKVTNINDALREVKQNTFDLIILDYKLPDGTCKPIIDQIKESKNCNSSIIIFSAYEISESLKDQVNEVILKTKVSNDEFLKSVEKFLKLEKINNVETL